jgi:hypothetical protein
VKRVKTDDLINLLAEDAPVRMRLGRALFYALVAGTAFSIVLLLSTLGMRHHMMDAMQTTRVAFKIGETLLLAILAGRLVFRIGRPDAPLRFRSWSLILPLVLLVIAVVAEMTVVPEDSLKTRMMGNYAAFCVVCIPLLSIAPLAGFLIALRSGAPEKPGLAGAVAGLAAGAIAAAIYAWHCPDDSPLFLATWYTLAIAFVTLVGWRIGRRLLRW